MSRPSLLNKGDSVALIAPSHLISSEQLEAAVRNIQNLGLVPCYSDNLLDNYGYFSGEYSKRALILHEAFSNSSIKAIFSVRGGSGATGLLDYLNFDLIQKNPKIIMGLSDLTAIILGIYNIVGLETFHGPVMREDLNQQVCRELANFLFRDDGIDYNSSVFKELPPIRTLRNGSCEGVLYGGNLSVISSMIGTRYDYQKKTPIILFIEDVSEEVYAIERMLTHIFQSNWAKYITGIVFGCFSEVTMRANNSFTLDELLIRMSQKFNVPCIQNFPFGHVKQNFVLPIGRIARLDADVGSLCLM